MNKQTILITGGCGYIGSHTAVQLQESGFNVIIVDNLSNSTATVVDQIELITGKRPIFHQTNCNDSDAMDKIFTQHPSIDGVIHFAASKAVGESVENPLLYYDNNIQSLIILIKMMIKHGVHDLIFSSSCTVYGQPDHLPVDESAPRKEATSPYGNTKQINEDIINDVIRSGAPIRSIILRYFNPIGAHESTLIGELPNGIPQNLIPYITQTAIGMREKLSVFGNDYNTPDGSCIRDYIDVNDLAAAHIQALKYLSTNQSIKKDIFNIGTGRGLSVLELIKAFNEVTGTELPFVISNRREGDIEQVWANSSKAQSILGWQPKRSIHETLLSAWRWQQYIATKQAPE